MIRRIRLRQWRSYEALDLDLLPGTTFVVAPNGIGKTSLVLGLAWAVFGDHSGVDAKSCIRVGADTAEVEVELALPDGRGLVINRRVGLRGRPKVTGQLDDIKIDEPTMTEVLEHSFGMDLSVAARLSLMLDGGHLASRDALDLKAHLYQVFGVADLLTAAQLAQAVVKEAEKHRSSVRATTQERLADRADVEAKIAELQEGLEQHREQGHQLQNQARDADQTRRLTERLRTHREQYQRYEQELAELLGQARILVAAEKYGGSATGTEEVINLLRTRNQEAEHDARQSLEAYATARGAIDAATEAIGLLTEDTARCPTCMRAISANELAIARAEHEHRIHTAAEAVEQHSRAQDEQQTRSAEILRLLTRLESLRPPAPPEATPDVPDLPTAEAAHEAALVAVQIHSQELGRLESQLQQLRSQISTDNEVAEAERELHLAYRHEAIATAAAQAFQQAVTHVTEDLIEPIATEVRWRWKQLFSNDGITLRADGSIVRIEAGQELGWETLSGGERIWARIVTHLLLLASTSRLPFAWFDEPLEHLDPQLRQAVAAALATATQGGNPQQLLITTYENALARQLAEDTPNAALINLRASTQQPGDPQNSLEEGANNEAAARRAS